MILSNALISKRLNVFLGIITRANILNQESEQNLGIPYLLLILAKILRLLSPR